MINNAYVSENWSKLFKEFILDKNNSHLTSSYTKIAQFAQMLATEGIKKFPSAQESLFLTNLKVISQIKDISRVIFTLAPNYVEENIEEEREDFSVLNIKLHKNIINVQGFRSVIKLPIELRNSRTPNLIDAIEDMAAKFIANQMNEILSADNETKLYIYYPIEQICVINDPATDVIKYEILSRWTHQKSTFITLNDLDKTNDQDFNIK